MISLTMEKLVSSSFKVKMDEGICWVVVVGSFLSQFTAFGFHNIFGQLYIELLAEFGRSKALTGMFVFRKDLYLKNIFFTMMSCSTKQILFNIS